MTNSENYLQTLLDNRDYLDGWETEFMTTLIGMGRRMKRDITGKQFYKLREIAERIERLKDAYNNPPSEEERENRKFHYHGK